MTGSIRICNIVLLSAIGLIQDIRVFFAIGVIAFPRFGFEFSVGGVDNILPLIKKGGAT